LVDGITSSWVLSGPGENKKKPHRLGMNIFKKKKEREKHLSHTINHQPRYWLG
jgi:hypothetical protein